MVLHRHGQQLLPEVPRGRAWGSQRGELQLCCKRASTIGEIGASGGRTSDGANAREQDIGLSCGATGRGAGCGAVLSMPMWGQSQYAGMPARRSDYVPLNQAEDASTSPRISAYSQALLDLQAAPANRIWDKEREACLQSTYRPLDHFAPGAQELPDNYSYAPADAPRQRNAQNGESSTLLSHKCVYGAFDRGLPAEKKNAHYQVDVGSGVAGAGASGSGEQDVYSFSEHNSLKAWSVSYNGWSGLALAQPLHRESSGSSFADSLLSGDPGDVAQVCGGAAGEGATREAGNSVNSRRFPTWAQQTEQTYSLQLALALRLAADAELAEEPCIFGSQLLGNQSLNPSSPPGRRSVEATAHRLWVNGSLGYNDRVEDGFYHICGINPHVWSMCNDFYSGARMPSLESLRSVGVSDTAFDVILVDKHSDSHFRELVNKAIEKSKATSDARVLAEQLGKLVCSLLGGTAACEEGDLMFRWEASSRALKECLATTVLPIGSLSVGLCRHRALLFKTLADRVHLPCRIVKGCKYCCLEEGLSCNILCGDDREFYVNLIEKPGVLSEPESSFLSRSSTSVASPLRMSESIDSQNERSLSRTQGSGGSSSSGSSAHAMEEGVKRRAAKMKEYENYRVLPGSLWPVRTPAFVSNAEDVVIKGGFRIDIDVDGIKCAQEANELGGDRMAAGWVGRADVHGKGYRATAEGEGEEDAATACGKAKQTGEDGFGMLMPGMKKEDLKKFGMAPGDFGANVKDGAHKEPWSMSGAKKAEKSQVVAQDFEIAWEDLQLGERVGQGSFGTVHRAEWLGSDVAVKILMEQDFEDACLNEFVREVSILKRLRHPNVVLFMGVVTKRPHLSIATEYLPRGSLFRLLHRSSTKDQMDEKRRIRMALDVAKGMNYLHRSNPPIVHRDLKSPNLLVDKNWTVKVCDFGLSRLKGNTFLSSRSGAGTPEWMAPEVLRDEQSSEKCDVYSFGVVLWELVTLQQPWNGLSPAQVVGAVGFQGRRLQIPSNTVPEITSLIEACWQSDPKQRPSFASIMQQLKPLQRLSVEGK